MNTIKEALQAGWNDRLFHYYQQEVDANAVRPQDENSQEWKDIIAKLEALATPKPIATPKPTPTPTPKVEEVKEENND